MNPKIIAFYLPQYHPTPDNDKWWGKGFTEWTNVGKARPLFRGHYQPKVPADLGYYDLRLPEVREAQAELACEAGIYGFCYYHYWFGNGKMELELPFEEVLSSGKPDFPFMLCWANESWHKKFWDEDASGSTKELLIQQKYPGEGDIVSHFNYLLPAFRDERYIRIDGKPAFMIYKPFDIKDHYDIINKWNELAIKNGLDGLFFISYLNVENLTTVNEDLVTLNKMGYDATVTSRLTVPLINRHFLSKILSKLNRSILGNPIIYNYKKAISYFISDIEKRNDVFPIVIPNWDHTPRSGKNGLVYTDSNPIIFRDYLKNIIDIVNQKDDKFRYIFLKSWNEWGEGNYIEPDIKFGKGYLNIIKESLFLD